MEEATRKAFQRGTHRLLPPAVTLQRMRGLFEDFGITRVANVTGLDCIGVPVVLAFRPNSRSLAVSPGKGLDLDAARASGVMEAIELFHAEHVMRPLKLASWDEMKRSHALPSLDALPLTSLGLFHRSRPILWIEGVDLMTSKGLWVPYELVHVNFTVPFPPGTGCFVMSSNGLASGNHRMEAISHGLCEVIERDAVTLFACRGDAERDALRVDLDTIADADARSVLELYERADMAVVVWDLTSDVGVPVFGCRIVERSANPFRAVPVADGWGCHPVRELALVRALTEAAQCRLVRITGSRDDQGWRRQREDREYSRSTRVQAAFDGPGRRSFDATPSIVHDTFEEDVATMLRRLTQVGVEQAIAVDLTGPELTALGSSVMRIVVPGLETHYEFPGATPGRRAKSTAEARRAGLRT